MFPDLGEYAIPVLSAYGAMILLIGGVVVLSLKSAQQSKKTLARLEERRKKNA